MRDNSQKVQQPVLTYVQVYALYGYDNEYTLLGRGSIEIVTDTDMFQSHHYMQVTNPEDNTIFMRSRLQSRNIYERQKETVILWNDPQQITSNNLAISFEDNTTCDIIWRIICQKIGKNYLEICGSEKLDMPSERNVKYMLQKIKTSYNLVVYHVNHSAKFMECLWQTVDKLNQKSVQNLTGLGYVRSLLSRYDVSMMQGFLNDPNFQKFLAAFQFQSKVQYRIHYKQPAYDFQLIPMSQYFKRQFHYNIRAIFLRQYVIDINKDSTIEITLSKVIKETHMEILNELVKQNCFVKIGQLYEDTKKEKEQNKQKFDKIVQNILSFFLQSIWILRSNHAQSFQPNFVASFYASGFLKYLVDMLSQGYCKALQVISGIASFGVKAFLPLYEQDYRNNPSSSIVRTIAKQFSQNPQQQFAQQTLNFIKVFFKYLTQDKSKFQFFNKTLILSIFMSCKFPLRILPIINYCINQLEATKSIFDHIIKYKFFNRLAQNYQKRQQTKSQIIEAAQALKAVLLAVKQQKVGIQLQKQIMDSAVSSGVFKHILLYLKNNLKNFHFNNVLNSTIMECFRIISQLKYNSFTKAVQDFDFGSLEDKKFKILKKYIDKIGQVLDTQKQEEGNHANYDLGKKKIHRTILEQEQEEKYLQDDKEQDNKSNQNQSQNQQQKQKKIESQKLVQASIMRLLMMKKEEEKKQEQQEEKLRKQQLKKREDKIKAQKNIDNSINFDLGDLGDLGQPQ